MATLQKKILLVDDSATALLWERMILQSEPYTLITASDGVAAVETAKRELPDLVLMDVVMPRMNGFEACEALRAAPSTRRLPIIMVTTRGEAENVETGYRSGCTDYVMKPIDRIELLAKVKSCLTGEP
jgi:DNA-binding response OmpR family regulator